MKMGMATGVLGAMMPCVTMTAFADDPGFMSMVPSDAQIVICARSLDNLDSHWGEFLDAIDMAGLVGTPSDTLSEMDFDPSTVDTGRTMGAVIYGDSWDADQPPMLVFMPVVDYGDWLAELDSTRGDVTDEILFPDVEEAVYSRSVGSYAVMGIDQALVASYKADEAGANKIKGVVGAGGRSILDQSDVAFLIDFEGMADMMRPRIEEAMANFDPMMMGAAMGGNVNEQEIEAMMTMYASILDMAIRDSSGAAFGIRFNGKGFVTDMALQFKPDSLAAKCFPGAEAPRNLLSNFQDEAFLIAADLDLKAADLKGLKSYVETQLAEAGIEMPDSKAPTAMSMWEDADGMAMVIYPSPAGLMGGMLNQMATFYAGDASKIRQKMMSSITEMDGLEAEGITVMTEYAEQSEEIDGTTVDTYKVQQRFAPEMAQMQQAQAMMFGPAGLRGYVASVDGGVVQTVSRNKMLLKNLIASSGGRGGLNANEGLTAVNSMLPANAVGHFYVGIGAIMNQVGPLVGMAVPGLDLDAMRSLPPLGGAMAVKDGGFHGAFVLPAPILKTVMQVGMQAAMGSAPMDSD